MEEPRATTSQQVACKFSQCHIEQFTDVIKTTMAQQPNFYLDMDNIVDDIRDHIKALGPEIFKKRNELLIAIRLVEAFRIFDWIKICLVCGSYQSVFRELRFILEAVALACYIDLNHRSASLESKIEVFKALSNVKGFYGLELFAKLKGLSKKDDIKKLYKDLSGFVHPSTSEDRPFINPAISDDVVDSLKWNIFDASLLDISIKECKNVANTIIGINEYFVKAFLQSGA